MKLIVIWLVIVPLVSSKSINQKVYKLPPKVLIEVQKHVAPCVQEHKVDSNIFRRVLDGTLPQDEPSKKFLYCFGRSARLIHEDGHMIVDRMGSLIGEHPLLEEFKESLRACNKVTKENPFETLIAMNACLNHNAPVVFSM